MIDKDKLEYYAMVGMVARVETHDFYVYINRLQFQLKKLKMGCNSPIISELEKTIEALKITSGLIPDLEDLHYKYNLKVHNEKVVNLFDRKSNKYYKGNTQVDIDKLNVEVKLPRVYYSVLYNMFYLLYSVICKHSENSIITVTSPYETTILMTINETMESDVNIEKLYTIDDSNTFNDTFIYKTMFKQIGFDFEIIPQNETTSIKFFKII